VNPRIIPEDIIQRIRERADIVEIVSAHLRVDKAGQNFKGLCPFHSEKTPSFTVSPSRQMFHCFGCGTGGDIFSFIMKINGESFTSAVRQVADRVGIHVPSVSDHPGGDKIARRRETLIQLNEDVANFFETSLWHDSLGKRGMEYLNTRAIQEETIRTFRLGFARPSWDALAKAMHAKGWTDNDLVDAGVAISHNAQDGAQRTGVYDRFRDRIIFPIFDLQNRVIAFGGRVLDKTQPKYLNSPETLLFHKSQQLYAMEKARTEATRHNALMVVEGYFDVIALHQAGIQNVVATLGTALTSSHLPLIQRFSKNLKLVFDPDTAGIRAALRTAAVEMLDLFAGRGISVDVVTLPDQRDPDTVVREEGTAAFDQLVKGAETLIDFVIRHNLSQATDQSIEAHVESLDTILAIIAKTSDSYQSLYLKQIAERLGIDEHALRMQHRAASVKTNKPAKRIRRIAEPPPSPQSGQVEEMLLQLVIQGKVNPEWLGDLQASEFLNRDYQTLFSWARAMPENEHLTHTQHFVSFGERNPEYESLISRLALRPLEFEEHTIERAVRECVSRIKARNLDNQFSERTRQIRIAEREGCSTKDMHTQLEALRQKKSAYAQ
tara:strand:- start:1784 stop:3604 length:1821 start_codon:yes stop_codon:yes gene_type:complete